MSKTPVKKKAKKAPNVSLNMAKAGQRVQIKMPTDVSSTSGQTHSHTAGGGLGRGLDSLISRETTKSVGSVAKPNVKTEGVAAAPMPVAPSPKAVAEANGKNVITVPIDKVKPSPWQPRHVFDDDALSELADSIKKHGIIQPLVCRKVGEEYELIGGERRLRASGIAGLTEVQVILLDVKDRNAAELALVENLQREELNIIEEAEGYRLLAESFEMTQDDIAERVGKPRATVANAMRLLELPDEVKQNLGAGLISTGHAKVLLGVKDKNEMLRLASGCITEGWTVRLLEKKVSRLKQQPLERIPPTSDIPEDYLSMLIGKLHQRLGTSVRLSPSVKYSNGKRGKGRIEIDFYDNEELSRLLEIFGVDVNEI